MTSSVNSSTGYGPSDATGRWNKLCFDGDECKYEQWEVRFLRYMRLRKLKDVILPDEGQIPAAAKKEEAFAELIQFLDDRSLALVMRLMTAQKHWVFYVLTTQARENSESSHCIRS